MKILFIGDIVAGSGLEALKNLLPEVKKEFSPDLVIANGENAAKGFGLTPAN
ncbi:YmdB family metallophosphoesterase, partial [bacterium]